MIKSCPGRWTLLGSFGRIVGRRYGALTEVAGKTEMPLVRKSHLLLVALFLGMWCCSVLGPLSSLVPILAIGGLVLFLSRRQFAAAMILVLASPLSVPFIWGVVGYASGNARLRYSGLPSTTFHNLDPKLRCGRSTYGCVVSGNEWISQAPYNCAVRMLTACFGWMPGTYEGPYPTEGEARSAVANGHVVTIDDLKQDRLVVGGVPIDLDDGVGPELLESLQYDVDFVHEKLPAMTAVIWQEDCIVLRIPVRSGFDERGPTAVIVLIGRSAGRPFAYYGEGSYSHHFPPVTWKRAST